MMDIDKLTTCFTIEKVLGEIKNMHLYSLDFSFLSDHAFSLTLICFIGKEYRNSLEKFYNSLINLGFDVSCSISLNSSYDKSLDYQYKMNYMMPIIDYSLYEIKYDIKVTNSKDTNMNVSDFYDFAIKLRSAFFHTF